MAFKHLLFPILLLLLACSCSTTSQLPEGEQLYTGIKKITYTQEPAKPSKVRRDSVGVITTISDAVNAIDDALSGKGGLGALSNLKQSDSAQAEAARAAAKAASHKQEVTKAALETAKEEVEAVLAYPPNNALFGSSYHSSPLQPGLWAYNAFVKSETKLGKWMFKSFATTPVLITSVSPDMRAKVAQNTLRNYGFFSGKVNYEIRPEKNPKKAKVAYAVQVGPLSLLDSIAYLSFPPAQDSLLQATHNKRLLRSGDAFSAVRLTGEQARISKLFRNAGYYYWQDNYTTFQADTLARRQLVQLHVQPSPAINKRALRPWKIGETHITVRRYDSEILEKTKSKRFFTFNYTGKHVPLRSSMWRQAVTHKHGELYRYDDQRSTFEKLNNIGVFRLLDVEYIPQDTTDLCDSLDLYVTAVLDKPYDSNFEMNATLKSNQQIGPGMSYELSKNNAFRGGERISFKIFGSYEWQLRTGTERNSSFLDSYELGSQLAFHFPRIFFPVISKKRLRFPAETTFAFDTDWKKRTSFFTLINAGISAKYAWHKKQNALHELVPLSIDFNKVLSSSHAYDSILAANPALAVSMRNQFVPAMSYLFTYSSAAHHRNPVMVQVLAKQAGNLTSALYALARKPFNQRDKKMFGSPFAQFLKATAELHYTYKINSSLKLATRLYGGILYAYGNSTRAPYSEQFYAGGANSVRGFAVRSIGPGTYKADNSKYAYIEQTGDVKLEANAELRAHLFGSLYGALFLDAGNVWLLHKDPQRPGGEFNLRNFKQIAVGTGLGLRYDLSYLVLRFDLGVGLHAPYATNKSGFYNIDKFRNSLVFHFAIGYPF